MLRRVSLGVFLLLTTVSVIFALRDNKIVTTSSPEAYKHYLAGTELIEKVYFRQAAKELEQAVAKDSNFAVAQAQLARVYARLGQAKMTSDMWALAISNKKKVSEREQLLIDLWSSDMGQDRAAADSITALFIAKYPKDREGYVILADREFARENWEHSIELFQKILKLDPKYANAYNMLGYLNYYMGRYDEALASLDTYIQLCPSQMNPHDSRGEILLARGDYDAALREFREAFNINPEIDFPVLHMAATYAILGEVKQMEYCFDILASQPSNATAKLNYLAQKARLYVDCGKFDESKELLLKVIAEDTDSLKAISGFAMSTLGLLAYVNRDDVAMENAWKNRRQFIDEIIKIRPAAAEGSGVSRSRLFMEATEADLRGDLPTAAIKFAELCDSSKSPSDKITVRTMYADVLWRKGDVDQAKSELQKNFTANPFEPKSLTLLADIADSQDDENMANDYRRRALAVWKNADSGFMPLAQLQKKMGASLAQAVKEPASKP
jgi:tetratricopeptide (TPR) repeat protein